MGKTSLANRLTSGAWSVELEPTPGNNFLMATLNGDERVQMWDISGDKRFAEVSASSYFRSIHGIVFCFDTTQPDSLDEVNAWVDRMRQWAPAGTQAVLCGTKHECFADEQLRQRAGALASSLGIPLVLTSAKDGTGVQEAFRMLVRAVRSQQAATAAPNAEPSVEPLTEIKLTGDSPSKNTDKGQAKVRPALEPLSEPIQSIASRFSCPVVAASLGPCGVAMKKITGMGSAEEPQPKRQSSATARHQAAQAALSSESSCEPERSDGRGGSLGPLSRGPACKRQLRA